MTDETEECVWCGAPLHPDERLKNNELMGFDLHRWCVSEVVIAGIRGLKRELRTVTKEPSL